MRDWTEGHELVVEEEDKAWAKVQDGGQSLGKSRVSYRRDLAKHERKFNSPLYCTALQFFLFMYSIRIARSQALS